MRFLNSVEVELKVDRSELEARRLKLELPARRPAD